MCLFTFTGGYAQTGKVSLNLNNASVKELFNAIEKQTSYRFSYRDAEVNGKTGVSVSVKSEELKNVLTSELNKQNLSYKVSGNKIIITPLKKKSEKKQQSNISGRVVDANGDPIIGATIKEEGTSNGAITDLDGNYSLTVSSPDAVLQFSYVGYKSVEFLADRGVINVTMREDTERLDEVVVTALGIKRAEKALSYNVQQVKSEELVRVKDANFVNSLNGKIAGVSINKSASGVGGATRVVMRGAKSIEGDNNALYVVDGIPLFNTNMGNTDSGIMGEGKAGTEGIADFNPEDIESISVLKDAAASSIYGSRAPFGVILVTTKSGKSGRAQINYNMNVRFQTPLNMPKMANSWEFVNLFDDAEFNGSGNHLYEAAYIQR